MVIFFFKDSLEYLDLSGCPALNWNGLEALWRLKKLKTLVLYDMEHVKDLPLICLFLLDLMPDLEIRGVEYIDTKLLEGTEHEHLLLELEELMSLPEGKRQLELSQGEEEENLRDTEKVLEYEKNVMSAKDNGEKEREKQRYPT